MPTAEQLKKQLLELSILTLVTVIIWIGYEVYTVLTHPSKAIVSEEELRDVPTQLDLGQLDHLKERLVISDDELENIGPVSLVETSFSPISTPSSEEPSLSPSSTDSGEILTPTPPITQSL